jgi:DNA-binding MurR/RpiR family transcriptional regulator
MSINDEIFARMDELSPAEKKVARALLSNYPSAGLDSAARLAKTAETSTPTVAAATPKTRQMGHHQEEPE